MFLLDNIVFSTDFVLKNWYISEFMLGSIWSVVFKFGLIIFTLPIFVSSDIGATDVVFFRDFPVLDIFVGL